MSEFTYWHHHGGVSLPNLDEGIEWYCSKLGFRLEKRFPIPTIPAEVAIIVNGDLRMELFELPDAVAMDPARRVPNEDLRTHGNKHVAFGIHDVLSFGEELKRREVDVVWVHKFDHGANIFIRDCAGNLIEFLEAAPPSAAPSSL
ncbi:MAG: VOC family protein [Asticcacaulis sp.]|uniref:VOC family protein n=1 Tax=Asticcacaulis sp. TaxID=1872648 RepID=UPI0039E374CF